MTMNQERHAALKAMLTKRKTDLLDQVQQIEQRPRESSEDAASDISSDEWTVQDDIEFALAQMKSETIAKFEDALTRLDAGTYGYCETCHNEINEYRLKDLPFAARCKDCEEQRERKQARERLEAQRRNQHYRDFDLF